MLGHAWNPSEVVAHEFLSGTVETRTSLGIWVGAYVCSTLGVLPGSPCGKLELATIIESIDNAGHVPGARMSCCVDTAMAFRLHDPAEEKGGRLRCSRQGAVPATKHNSGTR